MEWKKINQTTIAFKILKGEKVKASFQKLIAEAQIQFGSVSAIGMVENVTLGYMEKEKYIWRTFPSHYELTSLLGNISWNQDKAIVHLHLTMNDWQYHTYGGHLKDATVGLVIEGFIYLGTNKIYRDLLDNINIKTWNLK